MTRTYQLVTNSIACALLLGFTALFTQSYAQNKEENIYQMTEKPARPMGGMSAFLEYTSKNLERPEEAIKKGIKGSVFVQFVVEKDGKLSNIKILRGIGGGCDEQVVKILKQAPKWVPGVQQGKPVRVRKTLAINVR